MISVVIPVYNRSAELRRALEALACQSFRAFEVVVCDDGSSEDIGAVVAAFRPRLDLTLIRIANSGGPARPRNVAIARARHEWIAFLDSDDWWDAPRLERVAACLGDDIDLLYHPLRVVTEAGLVRTPERRAQIGEAMRRGGRDIEALRFMMCFGNPIPNSAVVARKSHLLRIGGISEDRRLVAEDFDTWLCLVEGGARVHFMAEALGSYWVGSDGISSFSRRQIDGQIALFARHLPRLPAAWRAEAQACHDYLIGSYALQLGDTRMARDRLRRARALPELAMRLKRLYKLARLACAKEAA